MNAFQVMMKAKPLSMKIPVINGYSIIKGASTFSHDRCHLLQFDGASNPNPGPSSAGAVIFTPSRKFQYEQGIYIPYASNNEAEYMGLITGLKAARDLSIRYLLIEGDSQLILYQVLGKYKVKEESLKGHWSTVQKLLQENFEYVALRHIYREFNTHADDITKYVLKTKQAYIEELQ